MLSPPLFETEYLMNLMKSENYGGDLIIPVYINQRIVFDLVATMRDGISTVMQITQTESDEQQKMNQKGGSFGLGAALTNFIKVDLQGKKQSEEKMANGQHRVEERYHTPTSLFARLLKELRESGEIIPIAGEYEEIHPGQLVEVEADLQINPMLDICETLINTYEMAMIFQRAQAQPAQVKTKHASHSGARVSPPAEESHADYGVRVMKGIAQEIRNAKTLDLIASGIGSDLKGVITIETEFLNDSRMADITDGHFKIVGKISRFAAANDPPIKLLRNTTFGRLSGELLKTFSASFDHMRPHVTIPDFQSEVAGPAIQIIPIAIYA
jgi:hypothetical protein